MMSKLHSLLRLTWAERLLWCQVWVVVVMVRLALWTLPFRRVQSALERMGRPRRRSAAVVHSIARFCQMVESASRYVPGASCLTQALAAQLVLSRHGTPTELKIGVTKDAGSLKGHAWLEINGRPVFGGNAATLSAFRPLKKEKENHWAP